MLIKSKFNRKNEIIQGMYIPPVDLLNYVGLPVTLNTGEKEIGKITKAYIENGNAFLEIEITDECAIELIKEGESLPDMVAPQLPPLYTMHEIGGREFEIEIDFNEIEEYLHELGYKIIKE